MSKITTGSSWSAPQKIIPFLWFDQQAESAVDFYVSVFPDSSVLTRNYYAKESGKDGKLMTATFKLAGQEFMAINGGPKFQFSQAVSFFVRCESQTEIDYFWDKLGEGGEIQMCGWLNDKYGLSWQIIPDRLNAMLADKNVERVQQVMNGLLRMKKIDISALEGVFDPK